MTFYPSPSTPHTPSLTLILTLGNLKCLSEYHKLCYFHIVQLLFLSFCEDDSGDEGPVPQEDRALTQGGLKTLAGKLDDLSTCNELIGKHGAALQRSLSELEELRGSADSTDKVKTVHERATLFRITSNAMINVSSEMPPLGCQSAADEGTAAGDF